ncbi:MAG: hypothetical protein ABIX10_14645 [Acidimicrobiales bacterium]
MSLAMMRAERDEFLLARHTGVMVVAGGGRIYSMPVWYDYQPGGTFGFVLNDDARRIQAIDAPDCEIGLTVHDESDQVPAFVTVFGAPVVNREFEPADLSRLWPTMVQALGGEEIAQRYVALGGDHWLRQREGARPGSRRVEMAPERWTSCDYAKTDRMGQVLHG